MKTMYVIQKRGESGLDNYSSVNKSAVTERRLIGLEHKKTEAAVRTAAGEAETLTGYI